MRNERTLIVVVCVFLLSKFGMCLFRFVFDELALSLLRRTETCSTLQLMINSFWMANTPAVRWTFLCMQINGSNINVENRRVTVYIFNWVLFSAKRSTFPPNALALIRSLQLLHSPLYCSGLAELIEIFLSSGHSLVKSFNESCTIQVSNTF